MKVKVKNRNEEGMKLYTVEVTQDGIGITYKKKTYGVAARSKEEAEIKAWVKAKQDCLCPSRAEVIA